MRFLLDTHTLLWWLVNDPKLSTRARQSIAHPDHEIFVSSVSAWEISTKHRLGKLPELTDVAEHLTYYIQRADFSFLEISFEHALAAGALAGPHKDPFDRMLIAQSKLENLPLITSDPVFEKYRISVVW